MSVVYLVLWICATTCDTRAAYIVETFVGETAYVTEECDAMRDSGRRSYSRQGIKDVEVHCWTREQLEAKGHRI